MENAEAKWGCLRAWLWLYNTSQEHIEERIAQAEAENAPPDAIYKANGKWLTVEDILEPSLRKDVLGMAEGIVRSRRNTGTGDT